MRASPRPAFFVMAVLVAACGGSASSPGGTTPASSASVVSPSPSIAAPTARPTTAPATPTSTPVAIVGPTPAATSAPTAKPTPTPTPKPTPAPTARLTRRPTAPPTAAPTPKPTPKPTQKPTPRPAAFTIGLRAVDFGFVPSALSVPAGTAFRIAFSNEDGGIPHNVVIRTAAGSQVFSGAIVTGASSVTYAVGALAAGSYALVCIVHPAMTGSLTVN